MNGFRSSDYRVAEVGLLHDAGTVGETPPDRNRARGRPVNAPHLVALVRAGAKFEGGKLVDRRDEPAQPEAA